ncbi:hypothetical protein C8R45DRAFT_117448 [Mycena sanguinolenta]|nr:hypothetical protein C8R45DRAFT_117448 [Mycena sanguinolenta]
MKSCGWTPLPAHHRGLELACITLRCSALLLGPYLRLGPTPRTFVVERRNTRTGEWGHNIELTVLPMRLEEQEGVKRQDNFSLQATTGSVARARRPAQQRLGEVGRIELLLQVHQAVESGNTDCMPRLCPCTSGRRLRVRFARIRQPACPASTSRFSRLTP